MASASIHCRIIVDGPCPGVHNMEVDAEMLQRAVEGIASVRTYQWSTPTISLGHFQVTSSLSVPVRFAELPRVKRLSGGGAILHDQELTYSLALPKEHPLLISPSQVYNVVHQCLIEILGSSGVRCQMRGNAAFPDKSFLCFSRGDERDIVIGSHKIVGSAQRRRQGAVLQHGSILLSQSPQAPEFPGISELTRVLLDPQRLAENLRQAICETLNLACDH